MFALESALHERALALYLDPVELRRANDAQPIEGKPFGRQLMQGFEQLSD